MIVDLNITEYIRSLMKEEKNDLSHIESEARVNHVPIVKPETKELLRTLVLLRSSSVSLKGPESLRVPSSLV